MMGDLNAMQMKIRVFVLKKCHNRDRKVNKKKTKSFILSSRDLSKLLLLPLVFVKTRTSVINDNRKGEKS